MKINCGFPLYFKRLGFFTLLASVGLTAHSEQIASPIAPDVPVYKENPKPNYISAIELINTRYQREIGKILVTPKAPVSKLSVANCRMSCDAYVLRQPILSFHWSDTVQSVSDNKIRIDISATTNGFKKGNFSTIRLNNIQPVESLTQTSFIPVSADKGQVLLNHVVKGSIVKRPASLPVFSSPNTMLQEIPKLSPAVKTAVMEDQRIGSLNQIRMLGRSTEVWRGKPQQVISLFGLQPGMSYRFRVVEENSNSGKTVAEKICRVSVCPADFVTK